MKTFYLPPRVFHLILKYCDNRLEYLQKKLHSSLRKELKLIIYTHPFSERLRHRDPVFPRNYSLTNNNWYKWYLLRFRNKTHTLWYNI